MKMTYRVQMMTEEQYSVYMSGSYFYDIDLAFVDAETAEEAVQIAKALHPTMVINEHPRTVDELVAEERAQMAARRAEEEKKAAAAARKVARDLANGITPEKRKAIDNLKRHEAKARRIEEQIAELRAELEEEERIIKTKKEKIERM